MRSVLGRTLVVALAAALMVVSPAWAADNTGIGDIAGVDGDLDDSPVFALNTTTLALVKTAFLASDSSQLASGANLPKGTLVKFMIYIDNSTAFQVDDVSVRDVLAATFAYQAGTIKVDNTLDSAVVCPGGVCDEDAIFAQVNGSGTALGDGDAVTAPIDADEGSYDGTDTIDLGNQNNANNAQLDIAASKVWAVVFTVQMQ